MDSPEHKELIDKLELLLSKLHQSQCEKARKIAHLRRPDLTPEDLLNPDNFKEVINDPNFMYEDGLAAGILSAKIAVRACLLASRQDSKGKAI